MLIVRSILCSVFFAGFVLSARAQLSSVPTLLGAPPAMTTLAPGGTVSADLRPLLGVPGVTGQVVQFDTVRGIFNVELLANDAPLTVANFLNYMNRGAYTNSFFHRSVRNFVIQGGGFTASSIPPPEIPADAAIRLENKLSNIRGTLAMARTDQLNSATSQWFVNTANNSSQLDTNGGGYTVFARVLGNGMVVADAIAALPITDARSALGSGVFDELPVLGFPASLANLVVVRSIKAVPIYPTNAGDAAVVTYSVVNPPVSVVSASIVGSTLTLTGLAAGTTNVTVRAADANNSAAQVVFPVTVASAAPIITGQPLGASVAAGQTVALSVAATGEGLTYSWHRSSISATLAGGTGPTLILPNVTAANADTYFCFVNNAAGGVMSERATLSVGAAGQAARLSNLSVRANLSAGQLLIVGFSTSDEKNLLVRGVGPKLADFGLANFYADPRLELYDGAGALSATNEDWASGLAPTFASLGAFPLNAGSKDAALLKVVKGGATAQLKGTGSGFVLVEVYDATGGVSPRLTNLSALNRVGTGGDVLIAGFTIDGPVAKTVLIRGVGPKLTALGVGGALADPKLEIFAGSAKLAENDNWATATGSYFAGLGAFPFEAGSKDAALLITLPPGGYTAQLSGVGGTTGDGLIEVYELP